MSDPAPEDVQAQHRIIDQIVELEREFYFENKGKDTERRRRLRDIIDRNTATEKSSASISAGPARRETTDDLAIDL